jgi:hypothetical protein
MSDTIIDNQSKEVNLNIKTINNFNGEKILHPCQYCGDPCYGKQCKGCHFTMVSNREADCIDCKTKFFALRKDGTKRKRCLKCQETYNNNHIKVCPGCDNNYHAYLEDGRVFEKCFNCYKSSFHKCANCDNNIKEEFTICGECYRKERQNTKSFYPETTCRNKDCTNKTTYTYCRTCNDDLKNTNNYYMVSSCQEPGCSYRGRGNFTFCDQHRNNEDSDDV